MTEEKKKEAIAATESLRDDASTNIWAGVFEGLEILRKHPIEGNH